MIFNKLQASTVLAKITAIIGATIYLFQAFYHAHHQVSILDEGAYLYKGYLFATGRFIPFQDFGPLTNHMPLSFLIPGYIQAWLGPGLRTGRYYSIGLGLLLLLGLWLVAKRLGGVWWAAAAVWALTLNPMYIRVYSVAVSQVLVACMLMWIMVLVLQEKAKLWQICLGSVLGGFLLLTRLNMFLVLPLLILYIFWQHGNRAGVLAIITGGITIIAGHALYWPGIMRLWAYWIPGSLTPFLNAWQGEDLGNPKWDPSIPFERRLLSFWYGIRYNFISMVGLIGLSGVSLLSKSWKNSFYRRSAIFLSLLITLLVLIHAWASLANNYCVFCFPGYVTFFSPVAFLLIIISFQGWEEKNSIWYALFLVLATLTIAAGIGYGSYQIAGEWLLELPLPRVKAGSIVEGSAPLWGILREGLGLDYELAKMTIPILVGLMAGILLLLISRGIYLSKMTQKKTRINFGLLTLSILLIAGFILSPSNILGNGYQENDCHSDVIAGYEKAGDHISELIPAGAQVYWMGSLSVAPLMYAPDINIYPPQINDGYAFHYGGDPEELEKFGYWNIVLEEKWKHEADFIIMEERRLTDEWKVYLEGGEFEELQRSPSTTPCRNDAQLRIYRRIK